MTNANKITAKLSEYAIAAEAYYRHPSLNGWKELNALKNSLIPFAKSTPISREEYEILLSDSARLNDDDTIYRQQSTWWIGDSKLIWCLAHFARQAALNAERGVYVPPTDEMMGLELVSDGLPERFRQYQESEK